MDSRLKRRWIKALRSGEFNYLRYTLHSVNMNGEDQYSALGILSVLISRSRKFGSSEVEFRSKGPRFKSKNKFWISKVGLVHYLIPSVILSNIGLEYSQLYELDRLETVVGMTPEIVAMYIEENL